MRSVLNACLVTVGVVLMAANTAEALTVPAAAAVCATTQQAQSGPCAIAGGALIAIPGGAQAGLRAALKHRFSSGTGTRLFSPGKVVSALPPMASRMIRSQVWRPGLRAHRYWHLCHGAVFSAAQLASLREWVRRQFDQHLFNLGEWNGTNATQPSGLYSGFFAEGSAQSSGYPWLHAFFSGTRTRNHGPCNGWPRSTRGTIAAAVAGRA